jgi:predicted lipid-binding transport protein (Tim44 family)
MRRFFILAAALLPLLAALGPSPADARAGGGHSFGSRGSRSYSAPRQTNIAPRAAPFERRTAPNPALGRAASGGGFGRSLAGGLLGGFLGAGIFGLLFGHGLFGGGLGFGGFLGLLIQIVLIVFVVRWLIRRFAGQGVGGPRQASIFGPAPGAGTQGPMPGPGNPTMQPLRLTGADRQAFAQCLIYVQDAWGAGDLRALSQVATPEVSTYFREQAAALARQGLRNRVSDVRIEEIELSEAWSEGGVDFATVAMRFSLIDVTEDATGRIVDGSPDVRALVSEIWTFTRRAGGHWILSAIQQAQ